MITVEAHKCSATLTGQGWHEDSANSHCSRTTEKFCHFLLLKIQRNSHSVIRTGGERTQTFLLEKDPETFDKFSLERTTDFPRSHWRRNTDITRSHWRRTTKKILRGHYITVKESRQSIRVGVSLLE
jgi:hypothetical protein